MKTTQFALLWILSLAFQPTALRPPEHHFSAQSSGVAKGDHVSTGKKSHPKEAANHSTLAKLANNTKAQRPSGSTVPPSADMPGRAGMPSVAAPTTAPSGIQRISAKQFFQGDRQPSSGQSAQVQTEGVSAQISCTAGVGAAVCAEAVRQFSYVFYHGETILIADPASFSNIKTAHLNGDLNLAKAGVVENSSIMYNPWDPNILFVAGSDNFCPDQEIVISVRAFRSPRTNDYEPAGMLTTALYVRGYLDGCLMGVIRAVDAAALGLHGQADTPSTPSGSPQQNSVSPPALSKPSRSKAILRGALLGLATGLQKGASESALQGHSISDEPNCPASDQNPWNGSLGMLTGKFHYNPQGQVLHEYESSSDGTNAPMKWWVVCR